MCWNETLLTWWHDGVIREHIVNTAAGQHVAIYGGFQLHYELIEAVALRQHRIFRILQRLESRNAI